MITKVTITGADNSVNPVDLLVLSYKYPFVEWGILVSKKNYGENRFPTLGWIHDLQRFKDIYPQMQLSCHVCGKYAKDLCLGYDLISDDLGESLEMFERIQINFHSIPHMVSEKLIDALSQYCDTEFIFQFDNVNNDIIKSVYEADINCSALFDTSGGNGILPEEWPSPLIGIPCGYAGGLSPENLEYQIQLIEAKAGKNEIWIDMESHVRSNNDSQFDLKKVEACLKVAEKFVTFETNIPYV